MAEIKIAGRVFNKIVELNEAYVKAKERLAKIKDEMRHLKSFISKAEKFYKEINVVPPATPDVKTDEMVKSEVVDKKEVGSGNI
jgi:hypothetical protein